MRGTPSPELWEVPRRALVISRSSSPNAPRSSCAYVALLEAGHRKNPSPETLKRLAKALGGPAGTCSHECPST